jgi:hypothetical protein
MIKFPAGYIDDHGMDLTNAVGVVNDAGLSSHSHCVAAYLNGAYELRSNAKNCSINYRVDLYISDEAFSNGKRALPFNLNGTSHFHFTGGAEGMTADELIDACEQHLLGMIAPQTA